MILTTLLLFNTMLVQKKAMVNQLQGVQYTTESKMVNSHFQTKYFFTRTISLSTCYFVLMSTLQLCRENSTDMDCFIK